MLCMKATLKVSGAAVALFVLSIASLSSLPEELAPVNQRPRQFRITLQTGADSSSGMQGRQLTTRSTDVQTVTVMENTPVMFEQGILRPSSDWGGGFAFR
jgi:hypothetical protein